MQQVDLFGDAEGSKIAELIVFDYIRRRLLMMMGTKAVVVHFHHLSIFGSTTFYFAYIVSRFEKKNIGFSLSIL